MKLENWKHGKGKVYDMCSWRMGIRRVGGLRRKQRFSDSMAECQSSRGKGYYHTLARPLLPLFPLRTFRCFRVCLLPSSPHCCKVEDDLKVPGHATWTNGGHRRSGTVSPTGEGGGRNVKRSYILGNPLSLRSVPADVHSESRGREGIRCCSNIR